MIRVSSTSLPARADEAIPLLQHSVCHTDSVKGRQHAGVALLLGNLASALRNAGRVADAIPIYERAEARRLFEASLDMYEQVFGPDTRDVQEIRNLLAATE